MNDDLILDNMKLVYKVANKYKGRFYSAAIDQDDIISEGMIGLIKAAERFDSSKGYAFSTFAIPTIHGTILQFLIEKSSVIKVPYQTRVFANQILKAGFKYNSPAEISVRFGCKPGQAVLSLKCLHMEFSSIDEPVDMGGSEPVYPLDPVSVLDDLTKVEMEEMMSKLSEKERIAVTLLLQGFNQAEIAKMGGNVRQVVTHRLMMARKKITDWRKKEHAM